MSAEYSALLEDWLRRVEGLPSFGPTFSDVDPNTPERRRLDEAAYELETATDAPEPNISKILQLKNEYEKTIQENSRALKQNLGSSVTPLGSLFDQFYSLAPEANRRLRSGGADDARHEIYSHLFPYKLGFAPDYRDIQGNIRTYPASPITPLNEGLAVLVDAGMRSSPRVKDPDYFGSELRQFVNRVAENDEAFSIPEGSATWDRQFGSALSVEDEKRIKELTELVNTKYSEPATERWQNLVRMQSPPSLLTRKLGPESKLYDYLTAQNSLIKPIELADDVVAISSRLRPDQSLNQILLEENFLYSADPVLAAVKGAGELVQGIRKAPAALLPGAADLIPSPEAIQTGYRQGPLAMGQQMGREFVQSLPTALAATGALAAVPAVAPSVGAGMIASAGAKALNEVVRQESGEGIVPKLRQAIGTAPRTGIASVPAPITTGMDRPIGTPAVLNGQTVYWAGPNLEWQSGPTFAKVRNRVISEQTRPAQRGQAATRPAVLPTVVPQTAQQRRGVTQQQNRNELQRRVDLARERLNPRRGEFGLSELIFGR